MRAKMKNMNTREELIQLKENIGMSWKKLSEYFGIPYRTIQDWYMGKRRMPEYLLRLMVYKAEIEIIQHSVTKGADDCNDHESR